MDLLWKFEGKLLDIIFVCDYSYAVCIMNIAHLSQGYSKLWTNWVWPKEENFTQYWLTNEPEDKVNLTYLEDSNIKKNNLHKGI